MSGVYIKGLEMPTNCFLCPLSALNGERLFCEVTKDEVLMAKKPSDCPLILVPDHGRLIDADALITTFCEWGTRLERGRKLVITMCEAKQAIADIIEDAPTIIPSEEGE